MIPFRAKLKKRSTEFVSLYTEIDSFNLFEILSQISPKNKENILNSLEFQEINSKLFYNFDVKYLRKASIAFNQFIKGTKNYPFFVKKEHVKLSKKNIKPITINNEKPTLSFSLEENEDFYTLKSKVKFLNKSYRIDSNLIKIYPLFCTLKNEIYFYDNLNTFIFLNKLDNRSEINFQKKEYPTLYKEIIAPLAEHFEVKTNVYKKQK